MVTSCTSLLALVASPPTSVLADRWGRKRIVLVADALFVGGALAQAFAHSVWGMVLGRSIVGVAVGSASFVVPLYVDCARLCGGLRSAHTGRYISELAPSPFRGRLVTVSTLLITAGQVVAYVVGWLCSTRAAGWRWMVGLGAVPAAVQFVVMVRMPDTPRWLVSANRREQAKSVLFRAYGGEDRVRPVVAAVLRQMEREVLEDDGSAASTASKEGRPSSFARIPDSAVQLVSVGGNRRALVIACVLQGFQQLCGFVRVARQVRIAAR